MTLIAARSGSRRVGRTKRAREAAVAAQGGAKASRDDLVVLASAAARNDPRAVQAFVRSISATLRGSVCRVLGPRSAEIDDVTQDATIGLLAALARFRGECTVSQFARRVAVLTAFAARRRQRTVARWIVAGDDTAERVAAAPDGSPLAHVEAVRRRASVRRLLDDLPASMAEAVVLYFVLGYSAEEVAAMTGAPVNTVWSRLRLGRRRLQKQLATNPSLFEALGRSGRFAPTRRARRPAAAPLAR